MLLHRYNLMGLLIEQHLSMQVLLDKSEIDLEIGMLHKDLKSMEELLQSRTVGHFAHGYLAGQPGDDLCVVRSLSRVAL